jgi:hypothetical protein
MGFINTTRLPRPVIPLLTRFLRMGIGMRTAGVDIEWDRSHPLHILLEGRDETIFTHIIKRV